MRSSLSLEERFDALMKYCEFLRAQKEEKEARMRTRSYKREMAKPIPKGAPSNKGSPYPTRSKRPSAPIPQAPQKNPPSQTHSNPTSNTLGRCFKCRGLGHIAFECPNRRIVSLAEWEANKEEEEKEDRALCLMEESQEEEQEEVVDQPDDGKVLVRQSSCWTAHKSFNWRK